MVGNVVTYKGVTYPSLASLCDNLGLNYSTIKNRISRELSLTEAIETPLQDNSKTYKGATYPSLIALCKELGLNYDFIQQRVTRDGMTLEQAIETPIRNNPVTYKDKVYSNLTVLCSELGLNYSTINNRMLRKLSVEEAIEFNVKTIYPLTDKQINVLRKTLKRMRERCYNQNNNNYNRYGGRGISVYPEWIRSETNPNGYENFIQWVVSPEGIGPRPEGKYPSGKPLYSIDRIDNNGNYEPGNLRWATSEEQNNNREISKTIVFNDVEYDSISSLSKIVGINAKLLGFRIKKGLSVEDSVNTPVNNNGGISTTYNGVTYPSLTALCESIGVNYQRVFSRINRGLSIEAAIENGLESLNKYMFKGTKFKIDMSDKFSKQNLVVVVLKYGTFVGFSYQDKMSTNENISFNEIEDIIDKFELSETLEFTTVINKGKEIKGFKIIGDKYDYLITVPELFASDVVIRNINRNKEVIEVLSRK